MIVKYWGGTYHVVKGGNVIFVNNDSYEEYEMQIRDLINNSEQYESMKNKAMSSKKKFIL